MRSRHLEVVGERENGRARSRETRSRPFFLVPVTSNACNAGYIFSLIITPSFRLLLWGKAFETKIDNFASQGKNPIRIEKEFLNSRVHSRPPTQGL